MIHLFDLHFKDGSVYPAQRLPRWTTGISRAVCVTWSYRFTLIPHSERRWTRLSGFDLHERLCAMGRSIPTIFITGHDDAFTREHARRQGAAGYFRKPFDESSLISAIETALARS
jgi:DNA-binding NtrC family response regulator